MNAMKLILIYGLTGGAGCFAVKMISYALVLMGISWFWKFDDLGSVAVIVYLMVLLVKKIEASGAGREALSAKAISAVLFCSLIMGTVLGVLTVVYAAWVDPAYAKTLEKAVYAQPLETNEASESVARALGASLMHDRSYQFLEGFATGVLIGPLFTLVFFPVRGVIRYYRARKKDLVLQKS